jgi:hypothetical protein
MYYVPELFIANHLNKSKSEQHNHRRKFDASLTSATKERDDQFSVKETGDVYLLIMLCANTTSFTICDKKDAITFRTLIEKVKKRQKLQKSLSNELCN